MKFIISENKLNKVIFNYLDGVMDSVDYYGDVWFHFKGELYCEAKYDSTSKSLKISSFVVRELMNIFGLEDFYDTEDIFIEYLISKLDGVKSDSINVVLSPYKNEIPMYIILQFKKHFKLEKPDED